MKNVDVASIIRPMITIMAFSSYDSKAMPPLAVGCWLFGCWLLGCWPFWLLGCLAAGLLGCWAVGCLAATTRSINLFF
jgi:hypothetical protein